MQTQFCLFFFFSAWLAGRLTDTKQRKNQKWPMQEDHQLHPMNMKESFVSGNKFGRIPFFAGTCIIMQKSAAPQHMICLSNGYQNQASAHGQNHFNLGAAIDFMNTHISSLFK
jgi:hypothetical protein